jgi:hypothetical protein
MDIMILPMDTMDTADLITITIILTGMITMRTGTIPIAEIEIGSHA